MKSLFRLLWLARFHLFQRHRHNRLRLETVLGRPFVVLPQVFNPALFWSSEFLARNLNAQLVPPGSSVLDLGTGSGVLAVFAAQWAGRVVAVDVNPAAVRCARINVLLHDLEACVEVRHGDLFAPLAGERFDVVLFNPPYLNGIPRDDLERAFRAPEVAARFAQGLPAHLQPDGQALFVLSTQGNPAAFLTSLTQQGFAITPLAYRNLISETLTVYRIKFA